MFLHGSDSSGGYSPQDFGVLTYFHSYHFRHFSFVAVAPNLGFSMFIEILLISMVSIWFRLFRRWFSTNFRCSHNDLPEFSLVCPSQRFFNDVDSINFEIFNISMVSIWFRLKKCMRIFCCRNCNVKRYMQGIEEL